MDFTSILVYEHHLLMHVYPATMFSTLILYPLYHVKMDESKGKTLCTIHHRHSSYNSQTLRRDAVGQSISINTQWLVAACPISHFNSSRLATKFYINHKLWPNSHLLPFTNYNYISHTNSIYILKSKI